MRAAKVQTPVLILSGLTESQTKVKSFGSGADDYLTKPYDRSELLARGCRRSSAAPKAIPESTIRTGKIVVNLDSRSVDADGKPIHLTGKEYAILELLSLRKGTTLTKEMFLNHLYGGMDEPELKIIDVFVCKLRKKLSEATNGDSYIETVWGPRLCHARPHQRANRRPRIVASSFLHRRETCGDNGGTADCTRVSRKSDSVHDLPS